MITLPPVSSTTPTAACTLALLLALALPGCTGLPRYGVPLPPLPPAALQSTTSFTMPDGAVLPARAWLPPNTSQAAQPRAVVLALHGFNDSRDAWEIPAPAFTAAGIALYAPDQRGFGAAPGRGFWPSAATLANDAATILATLRARYPATPLYAMGESMGGAVLMTLEARPPTHPNAAPSIDGWILLSPAVWGRQQMNPGISASLWLVSGLLPGLSLTGAEVPLKIQASDNRDALIRLARDPLTIRCTRLDAIRGLTDLMDDAQTAAPNLRAPTLILYGARDMLVPEDATARAWSRLPPTARTAYYPNGYHLLLRDRDRQAPTNDVIAWITNPTTFLPSGADIAAAAWRTAHH